MELFNRIARRLGLVGAPAAHKRPSTAARIEPALATPPPLPTTVQSEPEAGSEAWFAARRRRLAYRMAAQEEAARNPPTDDDDDGFPDNGMSMVGQSPKTGRPFYRMQPDLPTKLR